MIYRDQNRECPSCRQPTLNDLPVQGVARLECRGCRGSFFSHEALDTLGQKLGFGLKNHGSFRDREVTDPRPCVSCLKPMRRVWLRESLSIDLDVCDQHGVWFDGLELARAIEDLDRVRLERQDTAESEQTSLIVRPLIRLLDAVRDLWI